MHAVSPLINPRPSPDGALSKAILTYLLTRRLWCLFRWTGGRADWVCPKHWCKIGREPSCCTTHLLLSSPFTVSSAAAPASGGQFMAAMTTVYYEQIQKSLLLRYEMSRVSCTFRASSTALHYILRLPVAVLFIYLCNKVVLSWSSTWALAPLLFYSVVAYLKIIFDKWDKRSCLLQIMMVEMMKLKQLK